MQNFNFLSTKLDYLHNTILTGFSMWHEANEISVPVCFKLSFPICLPSRQTIIKTCIALWQSPRHNWWWSWGNATDKKFGITIFGPCTKNNRIYWGNKLLSFSQLSTHSFISRSNDQRPFANPTVKTLVTQIANKNACPQNEAVWSSIHSESDIDHK